MNIFFGKISTKFEKEQINEGYYKAPKKSTWFGHAENRIDVGDYAYIIGGNKIQLWRAREWGAHNKKECLWFDILNNDLGIKTNRFTALKLFKLTTDLIIHTSRSAKNRAFFKLEPLKQINLEEISNSDFYKNEDLYRKTIFNYGIPHDISWSEDLSFHFDNGELKLLQNDFTDKSVQDSFRNNLSYAGRGAVRKDKLLKEVLKVRSIRDTLSLRYDQYSLRTVYDTFFCEYKVGEKYFLVGAYWDDVTPKDQTERFVIEGIWENGSDGKLQSKILNIPVGSQIGIKASYVKEKTKSVMRIKARGTVSLNLNDGVGLEIDWEENFIPFEVDFPNNYRKRVNEIKKKEHINAIWNHTYENNEIQQIMKKKNYKPSLNQIFYGPPGTGKTFYLKNKLFEKYTLKETTLTKEKYLENEVRKLSWWQVITIALLDLKNAKVPDIRKHEWVQIKEQISNSNSVSNTIWTQLQKHTIEDCENVKFTNRKAPQIFNKTKDSCWEILDEEANELVPELFDLKEKVDEFNPNPDKIIENYKFVTFHQSFTYEDFIEGIKPIFPEDEDETSELGYSIENGVFKELCLRAEKDPTNKYAIFIDEINRGNVSAIFGELITLIELDKRKGQPNEIEVVLPYSKKSFSVPANIDIYGTMNTADRSVEALDTALRRRFEFKEMMPKSDTLKDISFDLNGTSFTLEEVLTTMNRRITSLLDRDYTIGHSYFVNVKSDEKKALADAFNNKVIPLLQEYFYGDYGKIGLVLGNEFVVKDSEEDVVFANFEYENKDDLQQTTYKLLTKNEDTIVTALSSMLGK